MQQYPYSGSDDEHQEAEVAGEPSSIIQAPGENTLRKNFQVLQEQNKLLAQQQAEQQRAHQRAATGNNEQQRTTKDRKVCKGPQRGSNRQQRATKGSKRQERAAKGRTR